MSIPVELHRLAAALADYGPGYLLTSSTEGAVKAVTVEPVVRAERIELPPSAGSAANLAANPAATLLFPPPQPRGFTLLVDGSAVATPDGIAFSPRAAVLHRPSRHADGPPPPAAVAAAAMARTAAGETAADSCANDCHAV